MYKMRIGMIEIEMNSARAELKAVLNEFHRRNSHRWIFLR
jgi:hypothetical protein